MLKRQLELKLIQLANSFSALAIVGPRQSGKTTLTRLCFPLHNYVSLEDFDMRLFAKEDPRGFLKTYVTDNAPGVIFDEIQHTPELFSYIQTHIDADPVPGRFILTGSQNFLLNEKISQTLAGRIAISTLLPLSIEETPKPLPAQIEKALYRGFYPRLYIHKDLEPHDWYSSYIRTYVERDVRLIKNITDLALFQKFLKLCAGRIGQLLNISSLASDTGISVNCAKGWLSLLESSYILFLLQPYYKNFSKRIIKSPKLYFYDTGVACSLLGIENQEQLVTHYLKGGLFESMILADLMKQRFHRGLGSNLFFWRDQVGHEVDGIIEKQNKLIAIEIKAGSTISSDAFDGLKKWYGLSQQTDGIIIYAGNQNQKRELGQVLSWHSMGEFSA